MSSSMNDNKKTHHPYGQVARSARISDQKKGWRRAAGRLSCWLFFWVSRVLPRAAGISPEAHLNFAWISQESHRKITGSSSEVQRNFNGIPTEFHRNVESERLKRGDKPQLEGDSHSRIEEGLPQLGLPAGAERPLRPRPRGLVGPALSAAPDGNSCK